MYPGSISDKELTRQSGILDLLNCGDFVMVDRGFDIEDDLILRGVHLNMPPFLRDKKQFEENELIITRRIASLRIHVERAMERIKNFHIFDRSLPADRLFFVCCALTNFHPPFSHCMYVSNKKKHDCIIITDTDVKKKINKYN